MKRISMTMTRKLFLTATGLLSLLPAAFGTNANFEDPAVEGVPVPLPVWSGFSPVVLQYGEAYVQDAVAGSGNQALELAGGSSVAWAQDFLTLPADGIVTSFLVRFDELSTESPVIPDENLSVVIYAETSGLFALDGNGEGGGSWVSLHSLTTGEFYRITIRRDYFEQRYDVEVNGELVATGLGFKDAPDGSPYIETFETSATAWIDDVSLSLESDLTPPVPDPMGWAFEPEPGRLESAGDQDIFLSTDFSGRTINGNTAGNFTWMTKGVADPGSLTAVDVNDTGHLAGLFDTTAAENHFIPRINVDNEGPWSTTVNVQPADTPITLHEVEIDYQHVSNQGTIPIIDKRGNFTVSVTGSESGLLDTITHGHLVAQNIGSGSDSFIFSPPIVLSDDQSYELTILAETGGDGANIGLRSIRLFDRTLVRVDTGGSVSMTAVTASDPRGVEYYFENVSGGGNDSGWQDSPEYTDTGLQPETTYSYRVRARDKSEARNVTGWSPIASATTTEVATPPMNVLVFITDDQRWDAFGAGGSDFIHTPNMDRLAENGVHFPNAFVTTSICMTSRASILTGQYMSRHGIDRFGKEITPEAFAETYPAVMRSAGYWSGFVGKWHIGAIRNNDFDFTREYHGRHWYNIDGEDIHVTERNARDSLAFLTQRPDNKPFVLSLSTFAPHAQDNHEDQYLPQDWSAQYYEDVTVPTSVTMDESYLEALPHFLSQESNEGRIRYHWRFDTPERFQRYMINYFRLITEVDEALGRVIDELKEQDVYENTLIIFMGDNGYFHADRGLADKWYPYEESIRVPLVIHDPRLPEEKRGVKVEEMVLNIDLAPTILNAAGLPVPNKMQGRDLAPLYLDKEPPVWREEFLYEHPTITNKDRIPTSQAVIRRDFKYTYWPEWDHEQLFDLEEDPTEKNNLIDDPAYEEVLEEMRKKLQDLLEKADPTGLEAWREAFFSPALRDDPSISGPKASPIGDGVTNLMKYALNLSPWDSVSINDFIELLVSDEGSLSLFYRKRTDVVDIEYVPEVSANLVEWRSGVRHVSEYVLFQGEDYEEVEAKGSVSPESETGFIRLKIRKKE